MNDLRVESYDAEEVETKKRSILKRMSVAGGAVVLTLGLFSLTSYADDKERVEERTPQVEEQTQEQEQEQTQEHEQTPQVEERPSRPPQPTRPPHIVGGSGSWFVSILEKA